MTNSDTSDANNNKIITDYFKANPQCDPNSKDDYVGNVKVDCSKAGAHAFRCTAAGPVSSKSSSSCKQAQSLQLSEQISTIQACKHNLYYKYASNSLSSASSNDNSFTNIFGAIHELVDYEMQLMDETLNTEIEIETYMSSVMVILAIMIIIYFLFSKIIIY